MSRGPPTNKHMFLGTSYQLLGRNAGKLFEDGGFRGTKGEFEGVCELPLSWPPARVEGGPDLHSFPFFLGASQESRTSQESRESSEIFDLI